MSDRTVRLHRVLKTTPTKLYRAFLAADALEQVESARSVRSQPCLAPSSPCSSRR
jgi:hypothetical protein